MIDSLKILRDACQRLSHIQMSMDDANATLTSLKKERREIAEDILPALFAEHQVDRIGDASNQHDFVLSEFVSASLPKEETMRSVAMEWIRENAPEIMSTTITITLPVDSIETAEKIADLVSTQYEYKKINIENGVHHMTLTKYVRERLADGDILPLETIGAHVGMIVKMKEKKP